MKNINKGFTLIEVMIVVAIIGILAAIAYPSYDEYVKRGNRAEGMAQLNDIAARQERYYAQNNEYIIDSNEFGKLGLTVVSGKVKSATEKYETTVAEGDDADGGYVLTAENKFNDDACGNLTLSATGVKGVTGSRDWKDCWK